MRNSSTTAVTCLLLDCPLRCGCLLRGCHCSRAAAASALFWASDFGFDASACSNHMVSFAHTYQIRSTPVLDTSRTGGFAAP